MRKMYKFMLAFFGAFLLFFVSSCNGTTHVHNLVEHEGKEATCEEDGYEAYVECTDCDFTTYKVIKAKGHNFSSAWLSNGEKHYHECKNCDKKGNEEEHNFAWIVDKEATEEETGLKHEECSVCHYKRNEYTTIVKLNHTHNMEHVVKVDKTCTSDGNIEYYHCNKCNKNYLDENGNNEVIDVVIKASHEYSSTIETINKETYLHYQCNNCTDSYNENCIIESSNEFDFDFENGSNVVLKNSYRNSITSIDLKGKITISDNCTWIVSKDVYGFETYKTKVIPLNEGNNNFYIIVSFNDNDEIFTTYNLNIYRNHLYTYSFYNEDNVVLSNTIEEGETINEAPLVSKYECSLLGWKDDNNNDIEFPYTIRNNVSFYANWKINEYMVVFDTDGGNIVESMSIPYGTTLNLPTPIKGNDVFVGWECNDRLYNQIKVKKDTSLKAIWTKDFEVRLLDDGTIEVVKYTGNSKKVNEFPKYTTIICDLAFEGSNIEEIEIPSSVANISNTAFKSCNNLTSIKVDINNKVYDSRDNCNAIIETSTNTVIIGCGSTTISNSITSIGSYAFYNYMNITSITIPINVTTIAKGAFKGCNNVKTIEATFINYTLKNIFDGSIPESLKEVIILEGCTSICSYAFYECNSLTSITLPFVGESKNSNTYLGYIFGASSYRENKNNVPSSLKEVKILEGYMSIGNYAFSNCSNLTNIEIPNSVTNIGNNAFYNCYSLTSIEIPSGVTSIGWFVFVGCSSLKSIKVDSNNKIYDSRENCNAVIETSTNTLIIGCMNTTIPTSIINIGEEAFVNCSSLISIEIPNSVTSIGRHAFSGCSGLTSITIPNSVTSIEEFAFYNCSSLTSITIPNSVTSIGGEAFENCSSLTNIEIPSSVTSIGWNAFSGCSSLTSIKIDANNKIYDSRDNCNAIIETANNTLIFGCKETLIPNSVTSIGSFAFSGCSRLTSIKIPNSVTSIGERAFYDCSSLTNIEIPSTVTSIGRDAFRGCSNLTIYCEVSSKPLGWNEKWNSSSCEVVWNYKKYSL